MINSHHDKWLDSQPLFHENLPRFEAIWQQISSRFASYPDDALVFELFNEPKHMTVSQLNEMNSKVLALIREKNPTRQVHFGGLAQMGVDWLLEHPDDMVFPSGDEHLAVTVHSYSPWDFAGVSHPPHWAPKVHTYDPSGPYNSTKLLRAWSDSHGIPITHDEFGCTVLQTNRTARLEYYAANSKAHALNNISWATWDDNGWWRILNRTGDRTWDEGVLQALGLNTSIDEYQLSP